MELFDVGPRVAISALTGAAIVVLASIFFFVRSAPPSLVTITSGPEGSIFQKEALKYAKILEANGVHVKVLPSQGSLENLQRLADPKKSVDVGIVQVGVENAPTRGLVSLGSISYQPLLVFYRGKPLEFLSGLKGKKIAIGSVGSGTRKFASTLLKANGIQSGGSTTLLDWDAEEASRALLDNRIDAAFIMSESASIDILKKLVHADGVHLLSFRQASAYSRRIDSLNVLSLPQGVIDFGRNIPDHDITLLGPMVELIARKSLHPAISDLLLEAATEVHSRPGIFQRRGEFPAPIEHIIPISNDASRFYKSGKSLLYGMFPFWLASLLSRIIVVFIPMLVVLIPTLKSIPAFFRWRAQSRIHRRYRDLLFLEKDLFSAKGQIARELLRARFDRIEEAVNKMKVPAAYGDQFYALRGHIDYVRKLVFQKQGV